MDLLTLDPTQFENLTLELVNSLGLKNTVWRTPGSDVGRDIQGEFFITDLSGFFQSQKWYVECKRYSGSIDWPTVWQKIAYAETHNCDVLLFSTTSSLTPQACDQINTWNLSNKKPLIRFWTGKDVVTKIAAFPWLAQKYGLLESPSEFLGRILLPANKLLLKLNYSLGFDKAYIKIEKIEMIQSLSELISIRLNDLAGSGVYRFTLFKECYDRMDWLGAKNEYLEIFDSSSIRAFMYYLKMLYGATGFDLTLDGKNLKINIDSNFTENALEHMAIISSLANFTINHYDDFVHIEVI